MTVDRVTAPPVPSDRPLHGALVPTRADQTTLPSLIVDAGEDARRRFLEFFLVSIRNPSTRQAYARAIGQFFAWCDARELRLDDISPLVVATYIEQHPGARPTVKQHLAAIWMCFDWLVSGQVLRVNPAAAVRGPSHVVTRGKTPSLTAARARALLDSLDTTTLVGLRDRALLGVMGYTFARVGAVIGLRVEDYYQNGKALGVPAPRERRQAPRGPCASPRRGLRGRLPRRGWPLGRDDYAGSCGVPQRR